ncbi:MAG: GNAT family N-acetyltransferase [Candidatus Heimdallarchaeota archaeon]|nr:GNAT family N-acetyltransferase [Candidatus Heimdallarchaeota archaeon]
MKSRISVYPATSDRWDDLLQLFGPTGAYWNCWCMYWRFSAKDFDLLDKDNKIITLQNFVKDSDYIPGLLAYMDDKPVGWIGFSPRNKFERLLRSRVIKPVDDLPVWSLVCFFIDKNHRNQGVAKQLIIGAKDFIEEHGIPAIECYPVNNKGEKLSNEASYVGTVGMFENYGFKIVGKTKSKTENKERVIMRYYNNN